MDNLLNEHKTKSLNNQNYIVKRSLSCQNKSRENKENRIIDKNCKNTAKTFQNLDKNEILKKDKVYYNKIGRRYRCSRGRISKITISCNINDLIPILSVFNLYVYKVFVKLLSMQGTIKLSPIITYNPSTQVLDIH